VRQYAGVEWSWDVRLLMAADQVAGTALAVGRPLGFASWLGTRTSTLAADDLVYQPETRDTRNTRASRAASAQSGL